MATDPARPDPPSFPPGPGHRWTPVEDTDSGVRLVTQPRPCRWTVGPGHRQCGRPAVIEIARGTSTDPQWWGYCLDAVRSGNRDAVERHGYGRWIEGGKVMIWAQRPEGGTDA